MVSTYGKTHTSRRLVQGRGVYDAPTNCQRDPLYKLWHNMLSRCYGVRTPSNLAYSGCEVVTEWYSFMAFRDWALKQDWEGNQLDKDLIVPGNKVYGPEACCFVPRVVNMIGPSLTGTGYIHRTYKKVNPYEAGFRGKFLGAFATPEEASHAWKVAKLVATRKVLADYEAGRHDPRVVIALNRIINELEGE